MRHPVRSRVVDCLVPAIDSASIVAGVANVCQRSSDFFNLYCFGKAGKEILFSFSDQYVCDPFFLFSVFFFIPFKVVGFVFLLVVISLKRKQSDCILSFWGIILIEIIIEREAKTAIFNLGVNGSPETFFHLWRWSFTDWRVDPPKRKRSRIGTMARSELSLFAEVAANEAREVGSARERERILRPLASARIAALPEDVRRSRSEEHIGRGYEM
jgi:hypothetical protein